MPLRSTAVRDPELDLAYSRNDLLQSSAHSVVAKSIQGLLARRSVVSHPNSGMPALAGTDLSVRGSGGALPSGIARGSRSSDLDPGASNHAASRALFDVPLVAAMTSAAKHAQLVERLPGWQIRPVDQPDDR